ncbi:hypothetical protein [Streptomyces sp. NPDC047014]|uniref:hypothetical protein n=1 Tax=Streptomyces sp. NPDC047014 TaxID=3155736 RepID=UPI0033CAC242
MPATFEMSGPGWRDGYAEAAKDVAGLNSCATWKSAESSADAFIRPLLGEAL